MIGCAKKAELRVPSGAADRGVDSNAVATQLTFWNRSYGEALPAKNLKLSSTSRTHVFFRPQALCIHHMR
jgi:hypothetical protein